MFCTKCGRDLEEGTSVCPWCGEAVGREPPRKPSKGRRTAAAALVVVAILLIASAAVVVLNNNGGNSGSGSSGSGSSDTTYTTDDDSISVTGTYASYFDVSYEENDDGTLTFTFTLDDTVASNYSTFTWYLYDTSNQRVYSSESGSDPSATWTTESGTFGQYTVYVSCRNSDNGMMSPGGFGGFGFSHSLGQQYYFTLTIEGTITETYTWTYGGNTYTVSIDYEYSEYEAAAEGTSVSQRQYTTTFDVIKNFLVVDDTVAELQTNLAAAYVSATGDTADGQAYAEYLLAFVQICFEYYDDAYTYGYEEYFAYSIETIYNGGGDCEDTSILLTCLYLAAGYDAGVFVVYGHVFSAISLDEYTAGSTDSTRYSVAQFSYTYNGKTYYGCETTTSSNTYGIGWISDTYGIDSSGTTYYDGRAMTTLDYGLKLPTSTSSS